MRKEIIKLGMLNVVKRGRGKNNTVQDNKRVKQEADICSQSASVFRWTLAGRWFDATVALDDNSIQAARGEKRLS